MWRRIYVIPVNDAVTILTSERRTIFGGHYICIGFVIGNVTPLGWFFDWLTDRQSDKLTSLFRRCFCIKIFLFLYEHLRNFSYWYLSLNEVWYYPQFDWTKTIFDSLTGFSFFSKQHFFLMDMLTNLIFLLFYMSLNICVFSFIFTTERKVIRWLVRKRWWIFINVACVYLIITWLFFQVVLMC